MESYVQQLVEEHDANPTRLLEMLRRVQERYRYIPEQAIDLLAAALQIPRSRVIGVTEFYSFFHLQPRGQYDILVSDSITDHMLGKHELMDYLSEKLNVSVGAVREDGLVSLNNTSCTGLCDQGPAGLINGVAVTRLDAEKVDKIADLIAQLLPVSEWPAELFEVADNIHKKDLLLSADIPPGDAIRAAVARGRAETLTEIDRSGLRGRGGAGFNTAAKWRYCAQEAADERYVVCNADEGEPGTFKDRVLLNSYAHQVFEGMTVCAALIGAKQGLLYLRGEYLFLHRQLQQTLAERRRQGLLGTNVLDLGFDFDIEIRVGAGAYICGEESALIESLEGKPGVPRNRPPYPVVSGYLGCPTVVNNVETFVAAAAIAIRGGSWFSAAGTAQSAGTKILSISGDCGQPGIYEYAFGVSIKQILADCDATAATGVQIGGPSGTFITLKEFDRLLAFEDLPTGGSFIIFNQTRRTLDMVRNFTHFFAHESCGFCTPCRVGTSLLQKQVDKIYFGHGSAGDLAELEQLCQLVKSTSHCGLGQTAANPILSTLQRQPEVYEHLLKEISFEPGFDLDGALAIARQLTGRDDSGAHLSQTGQ